jgi:hypothetical protein
MRMSRAKNLVVYGNAFAALFTIIVLLVMVSAEIPGNYNDFVATKSPAALAAIIIPIIVVVISIAGQVVNWVGLTRIDGVNRQNWCMWFLIIGIVSLVVNPVSGALYIAAYIFANRDFARAASDNPTQGLKNLPTINDWTLQSDLKNLQEWGILSDSEATSVRSELQI